MNWLWQDKTTPRDVPASAYRYLVTELRENPDSLTSLRCVREPGFDGGEAGWLVRLYDSSRAGETHIKDFADLDEHPELIVFEGFVDLRDVNARLHRTQ